MSTATGFSPPPGDRPRRASAFRAVFPGARCEATDTAHATATDPQGNRVTSNRATATIQVNGGKDDNCRKQHGGYGKTS